MMKPRKHAELIKAWADGAEIQFRMKYDDNWENIKNPAWNENFEYRIKPEPKPDVVYYGTFGVSSEFSIDCCFTRQLDKSDQIKLTFDGETGTLKSAEVL